MEKRNLTAEALTAVAGERKRQDEIWEDQVPDYPPRISPERMYLVLSEEWGEVAKELLEYGGNLKDELIQVAGVAVKFIEIELLREEYERQEAEELARRRRYAAERLNAGQDS